MRQQIVVYLNLFNFFVCYIASNILDICDRIETGQSFQQSLFFLFY